MPAGITSVVWTAQPHTIAKIAILETYLVEYFRILGSTRLNQNFLFIDGFSGPNVYKNLPDGSPSAALRAAETAMRDLGPKWRAGKINFAFVESDQARYSMLVNRLPQTLATSRTQIHTYNRSFIDAFPIIKQTFSEPFLTDSPLFVFLDPFGATGAPFNTVAEILNSNCSEVLINLDADGVSRIFKAKKWVDSERILTDLFGDQSWKAELLDGQSFSAQCRIVLQLYKQRLRTLPSVRYIFETEMQGAAGTLNYFLVFASKHPLGLVKMKEAMKRISQNGTYKFADRDVGQPALFKFDDPKAYYMTLFDSFKGQRVKYDSVQDDVTAFALNHTPFVNAKAMLRLLEAAGMITAISDNEKRNQRTFNKTVTMIDFHGSVQDGFLF